VRARRLLRVRDDIVHVLTRARVFRGRHYRSEDHFEADVWSVLWRRADRRWTDKAADILLTSHTSRERAPWSRSAERWEKCLRQRLGPDVRALGSNNRVDIVVRPPAGGSIGIEVEWFSRSTHAKKRSASVLAHGLGQAALALTHRNLTILVIGGSASRGEEARELRRHLVHACRGSRMRAVGIQ
jgi:hypothetical protein